MFGTWIRTALGLWSIALILWILVDRGTTLPIYGWERVFFALGLCAMTIQIFTIFRNTLDRAIQRTKRKRCPRCGKPSVPGLVYCEKHLQEVRKEAAEKDKRSLV